MGGWAKYSITLFFVFFFFKTVLTPWICITLSELSGLFARKQTKDTRERKKAQTKTLRKNNYCYMMRLSWSFKTFAKTIKWSWNYCECACVLVTWTLDKQVKNDVKSVRECKWNVCVRIKPVCLYSYFCRGGLFIEFFFWKNIQTSLY